MLVQKGHALVNSFKSSRICSRHVVCDEFGLLPDKIRSVNDLVIRSEGGKVLNPPKRKKTDREHIPPPKRLKKSPPPPVADIVADNINVLVDPMQSELELLRIQVGEQLRQIEQLKNEISHLKNAKEHLEDSKEEESLQLIEVSKPFTPNITFHCDFENPLHTRNWCGIANLSSLWKMVEPFIELSTQQTWALECDSLSPQLFFYRLLLWMRKGLSMNDVKGSMNKQTFSRRIHSFILALQTWALSLVSFPSSIEAWKAANNGMKTSQVRRDQTIRSCYPNQVFFFVDGTCCSVSEPNICSMSRQHFWNSKHSCHGVSFFVLCDPAGRIVFTSQVYEGSIGDAEAWKNEKMDSVLKDKFPSSFFESESQITPTIAGDKAYPRIKIPDGWKLHTTRVKASKADLKDAKCVIDPKVAPHRSVVERVIMRIKKWKIWGKETFLSLQSLSFLSKLLLVTCALTNYEVFIDKQLPLIYSSFFG